MKLIFWMMILTISISGCISSNEPIKEKQSSGGTKISDVLSNPAGFLSKNIQVSGKITEVLYTQTETPPITYTAYFKIDDGTGAIWVATQDAEPISIPEGSKISVKGFLMAQFKSSSINRTFDVIIFSNPDDLTFLETPIKTSNPIQEDKN